MTKRLLILQGLAALMVPIHHASAYGFLAMFQWTDRYSQVSVPNYGQVGTLPYYITLTVRQFDAFAIPTFLFISGCFIAFMARGKQTNLSLKMVLPRIKVLLIPLILWTALRFVLLRRMPESVLEIFDPYYFLVLLIQYYLFSPVLVRAAKTHWVALLIGSVFLQFMTSEAIRYVKILGISVPGYDWIVALTPRWFFPGRIFFFTLGLVAGIHQTAFKAWITEHRGYLLAFLVTFGILALVEYELVDRLNGEEWLGPNNLGFSIFFYGTSFSVCFLAFEDVSIPFSKWLSDLGTKSLGVYMANIPVIYITAVLMYRFTPWILGNQYIYQTALTIIGLFFPLLMMEFTRRTPVRIAYRYLFG